MLNFICSLIKSKILYIILSSICIFFVYRYISLEKQIAIYVENEKQLLQNLKEQQCEIEETNKYKNVIVENFKQKELEYKKVTNNISDIKEKITTLEPSTDTEIKYIQIGF